MALVGVKHKLSTAYHPQTDGQTERLNQTLEQYLRNFVNFRQDNWVKLLPMAQFAYNSAVTETTKISPFYANYGYEPRAYGTPIEFPTFAQKAILDVNEFKTLHEEMADDIKFIKEGDRVYLLRKNIKTQRPSNKLDHVKLGPFKIKKEISSVNYELELPKGMQIHPVFHVSLLEPASTETPLQVKPTLIEPGDQGEYEPEQILDLGKHLGTTWSPQEVPADGSGVSSTKPHCATSKSRSNEGDGNQSQEVEEELAPVGSDVATVLASALSFSNRSSSSSFSNDSIFSTPRRIISPARFSRNSS